MKKKHKNIIKKILVFVLLLSALTLSLKLNRDYFPFEIHLKDYLSNINKLLVAPVAAISEEEQTDQSESYLIQKNINASLEKEIQELKELLNLNSTLTEYTTTNASIISRNSSYWFNSITIDKGKSDGIKKDMAVITKNGLIGKISKTTNKTSEVKLLTTSDVTYKTSVVIRIDNKDHYAILNGYDEKNNLLKVSAIDKNTKINKGDVVLTSGLGQMPQGIFIGTVVKTETDKYNLSQIVYVSPKQDYNNIHYVTVLLEEEKKWLSSY